ncbi:50S ribosomal protein L23 [Kallotenue papyrolyticum]|uniref:50S ribosomal protein L23 n=1 Tax=Kallotenue papyrolyticum TaxID=1325125 RepID=UPI0004785D21|nr:50S ribosomal protein L23 [Kallotenue papyrolyticum]
MSNAHRIIIRPVITEKNTRLNEINQYIFEVAQDSNKIEIKRAIEEIFGVTVKSVNIINVKGKLKQRRTRHGVTRGYTRDWKKAIVTLTPDSKPIDIFEGV